jgi:hypothetical protein
VTVHWLGLTFESQEQLDAARAELGDKLDAIARVEQGGAGLNSRRAHKA